MAISYCARARLSRAVRNAACASSKSVVVAEPACTNAWVTRYASLALPIVCCATSTTTAAACVCAVVVGAHADGVEQVRLRHDRLRVRRDLLLPRVGLRHLHAQKIGVGDDAGLDARLRHRDLIGQLGGRRCGDLLERARLEVLQID